MAIETALIIGIAQKALPIIKFFGTWLLNDGKALLDKLIQMRNDGKTELTDEDIQELRDIWSTNAEDFFK